MRKRQKLGQHLLRDSKILDNIVTASNISKDDTVFEIGTGMGDLTEKLCLSAKKVISIEIDRHFFELAQNKLRKYKNVELIHGNGFKIHRDFDIIVSNIPYSESRNFIEWLIYQKFKHGVVTVQKEFADKLLTEPGSSNYRAISVIAQSLFQVRKLFNIKNILFYPPPKVDSTVLLLIPKKDETINPKIVAALKTLFSFRGRLVSPAIKSILKNNEKELNILVTELEYTLLQKRVEKLNVDEAFGIASMLARINYEK